jgi:sporulation protein YlmC with PRC-barrel domain
LDKLKMPIAVACAALLVPLATAQSPGTGAVPDRSTVQHADVAASRDVRLATLLGQTVIDAQGRDLGRIVDAALDINNDRVAAVLVENGASRELMLDALVPRDRGLEAVRRGNARRDPPSAPVQRVPARELLGTTVTDADGQPLGRIEDVVLSFDDLAIRYAVVQLTPQEGEPRLVPLPLRAFTRAESGELRASVARARLDAAPTFTRTAWPRLGDPAYQARLRAWFANVPVRDATNVKSNQG